MKISSPFYLLTGIGYFMFLFFSACKNFYQPVKRNTDAASIREVQSQNRYFILRSGEKFFHMRGLVLDKDNKSASTVLEPVSSNHLSYVNNPGPKKRQYNRDTANASRSVLNEVHIYIAPDSSLTYGNYSFNLERITKIELIEKDKHRTTNNRIAVGAMVVGGMAIFAVIIAAAFKSSCPFVSAYDGNEFNLQGEIFGGAILKSLERHDYLPLKMAMLPDSSLRIKISNELKEHQFTNLAELWVIEHKKGESVLPDENGNLYSIKNSSPPDLILLNEKIQANDKLSLMNDGKGVYMDDTSATTAVNELYLRFNNPDRSKQGRLILHLKNSYFLDLLYGEMSKGFGSYYPTYIRNQERKPAAEMHKWVKDQRIPLTVEIKSLSGWKKLTDLTTIGPLAYRNVIVDLEELGAGTFTEIRLSSGFMFWEIDQAAITYNSQKNFTVKKLLPANAIDEAGNDVRGSLINDDQDYLSQPQIGNTAVLVYKISPLSDPGMERSYILHAKGYYKHLRDFTNNPNLSFLEQFRDPGGFPLYGLNYYKQFSSRNQDKSVAFKN